MFSLVQAAYQHHQLLVAPAVPNAFAPRDAVAAAYPPLATYMFYAMTAVGGPVLNCAQSALLLTRTRIHLDERSKAITKKVPAQLIPQPSAPAEIAAAAGGFTVMQMIRFLAHNGMKKFPVYEYDRVSDTFTLLSGTKRDDQNAIVFLPQDNPLLPQAHWTYGGVEHIDHPARIAPPLFPVVVYTTFYVSHPMLYWRAKVVDANRQLFQQEKVAGRACDCIWDGVCQHEEAFLLANPLAQRATIDGEVHVEGTMIGFVTGSTDPLYRITRMGETGIKQRFPNGSFVVKPGVKEGGSVSLADTLSNMWDGLFHTESAATLIDIGSHYLHPMKVQLKRFVDEEQIEKRDYENLARVALLKVFTTQRGNYISPIRVTYPPMEWATDADLSIRFPRRDELMARLAVKNELTKDNVLDVVRRMAAEEKWDVNFQRDEMQIWLSRVTTQVGMATILPPGSCLNCTSREKTYRQMCKACKRRGRAHPPEPLPTSDNTVVYVGRRALWSHDFEIPRVELKDDVEIRHRKKVLYPGRTIEELIQRFARDVSERTQRGHSAGPIFLSQEPSCFPRGAGTACLAFLVRLGARRLHQASAAFYDRCYQYLAKLGVDAIEPETSDQYLSHLRGDKRKKNEDAVMEIRDGWLPAEARVPMTGFPKAEKSMVHKYDPAPCLMDKGPVKPRFICCPNPMMLVVTGRYTHAQTKWLAKKFTWRDNLYYAGCSSPDELNNWLNRTLELVPEPYSIVDDISAMDSNHSMESFEFHRRVRKLQYPHLSEYMEAAYSGEERLNIKVGMYVLIVNYVNASGVTDTSYKNSLICLIVRAFAVLHGFIDISQLPTGRVIQMLDEMMRNVVISASGDDGLTRVPDKVLGVSITRFDMDRYRQVWSWAGFDIKVSILPPNRWRMATFLAMRPVWAGERYEWAPEPARRLRGMFWQIDNEMHHVAWARGVASQVLLQSRHLPVLSDVCEWFLSVTKGPINVSKKIDDHVNYHSPFYGYKTTGTMNERAISEFCVDYHVTREVYEEFKSMLAYVRTPYVNFNGHLFHRLFQEES